MMKKGITFEYFSTEMAQTLLYETTNPEHVRKLYDAGFDISKALKVGNVSNYKKKIWPMVEKIDVALLFDISYDDLVGLIETRKDLGITIEEYDKYFQDQRSSARTAFSSNVLLAYGQISVTFDQIDTMKYYLSRVFKDISVCPVLAELYDYGVKTGKIQADDYTPKYSNSKQLSGTKQSSKNDIQDQIDDLFEAAQNSIESWWYWMRFSLVPV